MTKKLTFCELKTLEAQCDHLMGLIDAANRGINGMIETDLTQELLMAQIKLDEAIMWVNKYQTRVRIALANKTCG